MQSQVYEEIERVVKRIKSIDGIIGVVLFGSYSRGDFDEGSDIDLLIIFKDKNEFNKHLREVYKITAQTDIFFQAISLTIDELKNSPLLNSALRGGKIYYAKEELKGLLTPNRKPYALITYSTQNLGPKERAVFAQKLKGRTQGKYRYNGLIRELGGYRVGRGVVMIPLEKLKTLTEYLEEKGIQYTIRNVWA